MKETPNFFKMLLTDYYLFIFLVIALIFPLGGLYFYYFKDSPMRVPVVLFILAFSSIGFFIYRILYFKKLFKSGIELEGIIRKITFYKDRGKIEFNYVYNSKVYLTSHYIMKNRSTKSLQTNMRITALIHDKNFKRAIIKDLYIN